MARSHFISAFLLCLTVMGGIKARASDDPDPNINGNITQHSSFLPLNQGGGRFPAMPNNGFNNNNNFLQPFSRQQQPFVGLSPFQQQSNNPAQGFPGFPPTSQHLGLNALQSGGVDGHNSFNALGGASGNGFQQQQQQQPGSFGSANTFQNQLAIQNQLALLSAQQQQPINSAAPGFFLPQQQQQLLQNGLLTGQNSQLLNNNNLLIQQSNNPFGLLALQQQQNPFVLQQQQPFGTNQQGTLFGLQQQQQQPFGGGNNQLTLLALQQLQQQNPLIFQQLQQQQNPFLSSNQLQPSSSAGLFGQQQQQQGINNINDFNSLQQQNNRFPSSNSNQILLQGGQFADSSPFSSNNNRFPTNNNNNAINPLFSNNQRQPFNSFGTSPGQHQSSFFNDRSLNFTNFNPTADSFTTFSNNPIFQQQQQQQQSPFAINPQQDAFSANGINPFVQQWNNNARLPFFASGSINNLQMLRGGPPPPQSELSLNSVIRPLPTNNITTDHQTQQQDTRFSCDGRVPGYYADVKSGCKTFYICADDVMTAGLKSSAIVCPIGTLFSQINTVCQWADDVDCSNSQRFYPTKKMASNPVNGNVDGMMNIPVTTIPFRTQIPKPSNQQPIQEPSPSLGSLDAGRSLNRNFNTGATIQFANSNVAQQQQVRPSLFRPMDPLVNPQ